MKGFGKTQVFFLLLFLIIGCYEGKVKEAASKLKVGMGKSQVDRLFQDVKFLKEQTVALYPNATEGKMRGILNHDLHHEALVPDNLIDQLTFDGSIKAYSYLIRKEQPFANPVSIDFLTVFINTAEDKVVGWGHFRTSGDVDTWRERF